MPTALLKLRGSFRADRHARHDEAAVSPGTPTAPAHLDEAARAEWARIIPELVNVGLITQLDRASLAGYCAAWSRWIEAERHIQTDGAVILAPSGYPVQSPWVGIANKALENVAKFAAVLGLSPSARTRIDAKPGGTDEQTAITQYFAEAKR